MRVRPGDLCDLDVIISSSTFCWDGQITNNFSFHRVVVDESHLFSTSPSSARIDFATDKYSKFKWCVTATPCVSSVRDLEKQLHFLNHGGRFSHHASLLASIQQYDRARGDDSLMKQAFYGLVDEMKQCMIRHTKSQRIQGSEALALPESTTTTVFLDMTPQEREHFAVAIDSREQLQNMLRFGAKTLQVERCLTFHTRGGHTKIKALVEDLNLFRRSDPSFRVLVFTQSLAMHNNIVEALKHEAVKTFQFTGSTEPNKRDIAIRDFQSRTDTSPAVFVITLRSGNVGITLHSASRVYLMEPSLDPAAEVQAAGRIHRLGQTKAVQVKKLVFRDCIESNIVNLHKEIAAGRISISEGFFPGEAIKILVKNIRIREP
jgi:SNF2 family DNA or RNA helicase